MVHVPIPIWLRLQILRNHIMKDCRQPCVTDLHGGELQALGVVTRGCSDLQRVSGSRLRSARAESQTQRLLPCACSSALTHAPRSQPCGGHRCLRSPFPEDLFHQHPPASPLCITRHTPASQGTNKPDLYFHAT